MLVVVRHAIEHIVNAELTALLGPRYAWDAARVGYRHGTKVRTVTSPVGAVTVTGPRARLQTPPAGRAEWESQVLPAYASRMRQVNAADLAARGVRAPQLCIIDGGKGLRATVERTWPGVAIQRCTVHKLRNLLTTAPRRLHDELRADYHAIVMAEDGAAAQRAATAFCGKWAKTCAGAVKSLQEAGAELLTLYRYPRSQWKSLPGTNGLERLNLEFRRRVKTQGSLPSEDAVLALLFGLVATGRIVFRKLDGWQDMVTGLTSAGPKAEEAA